MMLNDIQKQKKEARNALNSYSMLILQAGIDPHHHSYGRAYPMAKIIPFGKKFYGNRLTDSFREIYRDVLRKYVIKRSALKVRNFFESDNDRARNLRGVFIESLPISAPDPRPLVIPDYEQSKTPGAINCGGIIFYELFMMAKENFPEFRPMQYHFFHKLAQIYDIANVLEYIRIYHGEHYVTGIQSPPPADASDFAILKEFKQYGDDLQLQKKKLRDSARIHRIELGRERESRKQYEERIQKAREREKEEERKRIEELQKLDGTYLYVLLYGDRLVRAERHDEEWRCFIPFEGSETAISYALGNLSFYQLCQNGKIVIKKKEGGNILIRAYDYRGDYAKFVLHPDREVIIAAGGSELLYTISNRTGKLVSGQTALEKIERFDVTATGRGIIAQHRGNVLSFYAYPSMEKTRQDKILPEEIHQINAATTGIVLVTTETGKIYRFRGGNFTEMDMM